MSHYGSNLTYPILRQTPSFGDGMRPHADGFIVRNSDDDDGNYKFGGQLEVEVEVDWGDYILPYYYTTSTSTTTTTTTITNTQHHDRKKIGGRGCIATANLRVIGIGRRRSEVAGCAANTTTNNKRRHVVASREIEWRFNDSDDDNDGDDDDESEAKTNNNNANVTITNISTKNQDDKSIGSRVIMPRMSVSFPTTDDDDGISGTSASNHAYPEYVVELVMSEARLMINDDATTTCSNSIDIDEEAMRRQQQSATTRTIILRRTLHVLPPLPLLHSHQHEQKLTTTSSSSSSSSSSLPYDLSEVLWAPHLSDMLKGGLPALAVASVSSTKKETTVVSSATTLRRRGFGIELETVQLPPDADAGYFTLQDEYNAAVGRARDADVKANDNTNGSDDKWNRLLLWNVGHDPQVENAAPPARIDLYQKLQKAIGENACADNGDTNDRDLLNVLLLGGRIKIPDELSASTHTNLPTIVSHINQASPEYRSPFPPNELYHVFPPPANGDSADREIRLLLDGVLKNPIASHRAIICPTASDIGQSASSIHVHVNVRNPDAWPRECIAEIDDLQATQSLISVVLNWIRFDGVVRTFAKPWMWRDRSLAPMFASGPEFLWREVAWKQGTTAIAEGTKQNMYNVPAFFQHIAEVYSNRDKHIGSLFNTVFDNEVILKTLFRDCSLNLLALKKYGTVEFRRMHATLDADIASAWTWFCVGFVEKFHDPSMFDECSRDFFDPTTGWTTGLERLVEAQNNATIEDLIEIMVGGTDAMVPPCTFDTLMGKVGGLSQDQSAKSRK